MPSFANARQAEPHRILVVGAGARTRESVDALILDAVRYNGIARVSHDTSLSGRDLVEYAAILIDAQRPAAEWMQLAIDPGTAWRSRVLLDIREHHVHRHLLQRRGTAIAVIAVGSSADDENAREELARLLFCDPVIRHLAIALGAACSADQLLLVTEFIRRSNVGTTVALARTLARSRRSLDRDCERLGLNQPQVILQVARIARGLTWMSMSGTSVDRAAALAGYSQTSSFRRAARRTLGAPISVLLREWSDPALMEVRLRRVLTRRV